MVLRLTLPQWRDLAALSIEALRRHRLRTFLSVWGLILGIGCVTAMLSITEGARQQALRHVEQLGTSNILVRQRVGGEQRQGRALQASDAEVLMRLLPFVEHAAPVKESYVPARARYRVRTATVLATSPRYVSVMDLQLRVGEMWSSASPRNGRVCVLGSGAARQLFGAIDVVGEHVQLAGEWFLVTGILASRPVRRDTSIELSARDHDNAILVPLQFSQGAGGARYANVSQLWVRTTTHSDAIAVAPTLARVLHLLHEEATIEVVVPLQLLRARTSTLRTFNVAVIVIGALSLLISGIGILNSMLASVVERTSEIGLRRAVGAPRRWITVQFVLEGMAMTTLGGVAGALLGLALSKAISLGVGWPSHVSLWALSASVTLSCVTGLLAAIYPARRAANLQPIDALRHE